MKIFCFLSLSESRFVKRKTGKEATLDFIMVLIDRAFVNMKIEVTSW